jgi:hypothetical protein
VESVLFWVLLILIIGFIVVMYFYRSKWLPKIGSFMRKDGIKFKIFMIFMVFILLFLFLGPKYIIESRGTATRDYNLKDFFVATPHNMINNPIGVGSVLMSFFCLGLILMFVYKDKLFLKKNMWVSTILLWSVFALLIIFGTYTSIVLVPFRMWTFFALFAPIVASFAVLGLTKLVKQDWLRLVLILVFVILVWNTSYTNKNSANTAVWPNHEVVIPESEELYAWMRDGGLPKDSSVMPLCNLPSVAIGYDMNADQFLNKEFNPLYDHERKLKWYYRLSLNKTLEENYDLLSGNGIEYTTIGMNCYAKLQKGYTQELVITRLNEMMNSTKFTMVKSTQSEALFRVN